MIAFIRGTLIEKEPTRAVIEAGGVGYELLVPLSTYEKLPRTGSEAKLLAHHCVREDDEILFGFATDDEKAMFAKLTSVSGVGPKIALAILSGSSVGELSMSIAGGDAKRLAAIKGVGKKTAEKICVELRDKVSEFAFSGRGGEGAPSPIAKDAVAALRALGFNEETSAKMVSDVLARDAEIDSVEQIIKMSLSGRK
ncbi:MAG: Holliday junction branch migration protein RuvA [Kiritimatiellae bacterium]|jgi:Holliday junction DNA helicase RuvA|nr:Holliday junction branch migration protein RuvA [Kiritimatiellia bacterium]